MILLTIIVVNLSILQKISGANILALLSVGRYSHFQTIFPLVETLASRNHQVTFLHAYPTNINITNCNAVYVQETADFLQSIDGVVFHLEKSGTLENFIGEHQIGITIAEKFLNSAVVKNLLNSNNKFDIVILSYFYNEVLTGIAHHFHAPIVLISPVGESSKINHITGNPTRSSYVPNLLTSYSDKMNFWQRLDNFVCNNLGGLLNKYWFVPKQREMYKKYFRKDVESNEQLYNVSIILTVSHFIFHYPVPLKPSVVDIGTYHIRKKQRIPKIVQNYLEQADSGVVVFSLGSILKSKNLPSQVLESLVGIFSKLPQNVLWKFESTLENLPKNVKIFDWIPQQEVLAHPNVCLTIQHGGLFSLTEAVYSGVPVVGIPVFSDQMYNIEGAVQKGFAAKISLHELGSENMLRTIRETLNNEKINKNTKKYSKIIRDQIVDPTDLAVFWTEYVIRHRGASYLWQKSDEREWYEAHVLDASSIIILMISMAFCIMILCCKKNDPKKG